MSLLETPAVSSVQIQNREATLMEISVRRGEKVLRELAKSVAEAEASLRFCEGESADAEENAVTGSSDESLLPVSDTEVKGSENDSGIGPEPSCSGSGSEDDVESHKVHDPSTTWEDGVYEVEEIVDYSRDKSQYKVKWKDWHSDFNTWEQEHNLANCEAELLRFYLQRKAEREEAEALTQSYVELPKGKRRKRALSLPDVPPDPRPLQFRAQEFYICTQVPSEEEIDECEQIWKGLFTSKNTKKNAWQWPIAQLDKVLSDGIDGKLSSSEKKSLRQQLMVRQFDSRRKTVLTQLKDWEADINATTNGMPTVTVENDVDLAGPPPGFKYANDYVPGQGISIPNEPPLGCSCTNCIQTKKSCCAHQSNSIFAYSRSRKLHVPVGTPIFECNKACKCGPECQNRVVQDGRASVATMKFCIYRTSNGCGWGVKTLRAIKKGTFVSLYVGEVITTAESDRRAKEYDAEGCTYLFDLDFNDGDSFPYAVDAAKYGNVTHFFNHSCDPNLAVFAVWVDCLDPNLPKLALFAIQDIPRGAQLTFDYMNQVSNESKSPEKGLQAKQTIMKPCLCGAENCRKYLFI